MRKNRFRLPVKHYPGAPIRTTGTAAPWRDDITGDHPEIAAMLYRNYYLFLISIGLSFMALAFAFNSPAAIWQGMLTILFSPANLLTDYIQLANPGATLFNVGLMTLFTVSNIRLNKLPVSGSIIAGIFTMIGFSFFGKNLYNTLPIILGVFLYAKLVGQPFGEYVLHSMFGTALSPLVSAFSFSLGFPLPLGVALGIVSGLFVGLIIVPLSLRFLQFHKGYSLYNIGFTAGIIGMFFMAVLRGFGMEVPVVSILSHGQQPAVFADAYWRSLLSIFLIGLRVSNWHFRGFTAAYSACPAHCRPTFWHCADLA